EEHRTCQAYLRAAVDRYPHDAWLHNDLTQACGASEPPDHAEALRHHSAASALRPDSAWFLLMIGSDFARLGAYDQAIAAYRKLISLSPFYNGIANLWLGEALSKKKDWEAAIAALREAIRLLPERRAEMYVPWAHLDLGLALAGSGRHAEARHEMLTSL